MKLKSLLSVNNRPINVIIANGAFKSGSTWLFNILRELTDFGVPVVKYLNKDWVNPSIDPEVLDEFLEEYKESDDTVIVKNHFHTVEERDKLLSYRNVVLFDIVRDPKDLVVSAYYHRIKYNNFKFNFNEYYWDMGRNDLLNVYNYHKLWSIEHSNIYTSNYEILLTDFEGEVGRICEFLGLAIIPEKIQLIKKNTSLNSLRERYGDGDKFFRKGVSGDWKNYLDKKMVKDIDYIFKNGKLKKGIRSLPGILKKKLIDSYHLLKNKVL